MNKKIFGLLFINLFIFPKEIFAVVDLGSNFAFGQVKSLGELIGYLVPTAFIIAGIMVVFYFMTAAFDMIISHGDKNAIAAARDKMIHAIIGMLLLILSFVVVRYLPYFLFGEQPFWFF